MLARVVEQVSLSARVSRVIVATSLERDDDAIAAFCGQAGIDCFRGSLDDVAERLAAAAEWASAEAFVRISGDSPLMLPRIIDDVIALYQTKDVDLATNIQQRTFPKGLSVEVIGVAALRRAQSMMLPGEAEHVTPVFYRRPGDFRIANLSSGHAWGHIQLSVDTEAEFKLAERIIAAAGDAPARLSGAELVALRERCLAEGRV